MALGSPVGECAASMEAMRRDARSSTYNNPMAVSQILPALHQKSYLAVKTKNCLNEDGMCSVIAVHLFFPVVSSLFVTLCFFLQKLWCWSLQILSWFYQVRLK